jgi:hypothetical protein
MYLPGDGVEGEGGLGIEAAAGAPFAGFVTAFGVDGDLRGGIGLALRVTTLPLIVPVAVTRSSRFSAGTLRLVRMSRGRSSRRRCKSGGCRRGGGDFKFTIGVCGDLAIGEEI